MNYTTSISTTFNAGINPVSTFFPSYEKCCSGATPYKFNAKPACRRGRELDNETGLYYYGARYYTPELSIWLSACPPEHMRRRMDPLSDKYPSMSPFMYCAGNPVRLIDPDGMRIDDYYDRFGKYVGTDGEGNNLRIISSKAAFNEAMEVGGRDMARQYSKVVTVQENSSEVINNIYSNTVKDDTERKGYIILDVVNATLSVVPQPAHKNDSRTGCENEFDSYGNGAFKTPKDGKSNEIIVGQVHGHTPDKTGLNLSGYTQDFNEVLFKASGDDKSAAKTLGVPVHAVDRRGIIRVNPSGNSTSNIPNDRNLLIRSLEISGGKYND